MDYGIRLRQELNPSQLGGQIRSYSTGFRNYSFPDRDIDFGAMYFFVDSYGAVGDGVTDDTNAINACISAAGLGAVIVFTPGKTYLIRDSIVASTNTFIVYGAAVYRSNSIKTTTTQTVSNGATSFTVADASIFSIGNKILLTDSTLPFGGTGFSENSAATNNTVPQTITNIVGNTITVSPAIFRSGGGSFPNGSTCFKVYPMIVSNTAIEIYGGIFDGNKSNNTDNYSWIFNETIRIKPGSIISDCIFRNTSNENIFSDGNTIISNCIAYDLNGSFIHIGKSINFDLVTLSACQLFNTNIIGNARMAHSEGVITFSNQVTDVNVTGCVFDTVNGDIFAPFENVANVGNILFSNNHCYNTSRIFSANMTLTNMVSGLTITGNIFTRCGDINIIASASQLNKGYGLDKVIISDNTFINSKFFFSNISNFSFDNNVVTYVNGETVSTASTPRVACSITLSNCAYGSISRNKFTDYNITENPNITTCLTLDVFTSRTLIKSDAVTNTVYIYGMRNIIVSDNIIAGFSFGIVDDNTAGFNAATTTIGTKIHNNSIVMRTGSTSTTGINAVNGMSIVNNSIYANINTDRGILVQGANAASAATINGPYIANNQIYGGTATISMDATKNYNCIIINNAITAAISGTTTNSTVTGNTVFTVNQNATPLDLPRQNAGFY